MPNFCDPCPGKTNATAMIVVLVVNLLTRTLNLLALACKMKLAKSEKTVAHSAALTPLFSNRA
jgi:hypothetical protein